MHIHFGLTWLNQIFYCFVTSAIILIFTYIVYKNRVTDGLPSNSQNIAEMLIEFLEDLIIPELGRERLPHLLPFLGAFLLFILISNAFLIIPLTHPVTSDWSNTFALALIVVISLQYYNIKLNGPKKAAKLWLDPIPGLGKSEPSSQEVEEKNVIEKKEGSNILSIIIKIFVVLFMLVYFVDNLLTLIPLSFKELAAYSGVGTIIIIALMIWIRLKLQSTDDAPEGIQLFVEWLVEGMRSVFGLESEQSSIFKSIIFYFIATLFLCAVVVLILPVLYKHSVVVSIVSIYSLIIGAIGILAFLNKKLTFQKTIGRIVWKPLSKFLNAIFGILKAIPAKLLISLFIALHFLDNGARLLSLSLRLFGNIFGEHTVLSMVTEVALKNYYYVIPLLIPFLIFCMDVLFALIQTAVFVMLSMFYFKEELGVH